MVNTEIRLIIFFEARDGAALYHQQKQDRELIVALILIATLRLKIEESRENHSIIHVWPKSNPI